MDSVTRILQLITNIEDNDQYIRISDPDTNYSSMNRYALKKEPEVIRKLNGLISRWEQKVEEKVGAKMDAKAKEILYLFASCFGWYRGEQKPQEGFLTGGFAFSGVNGIYLYPNSFWEESLMLFQKFEEINEADLILLKQLRWFDSKNYPHQGVYRSSYSCFLLEEGKYPTSIYFYSNGQLYLLPFDNLATYVEAMVASCAVEYWQYFYIDPTLLITKNNKLNYYTHSLHGSTGLEEASASLHYNPDAQIDRLDLIHEHLERCVRLLPSTFPFANFTHHQNYYTQFKELYDASKKE